MAYRERLVRSELSVEENEVVLRKYWKLTLRLTLLLLATWFVAGYAVAIGLAPALNQVEFLGGPLGFWFAQNGAIYVFWLLILVYAIGMSRLDREFDVHDLED
jgi:putative solute:sodium symporter small subunit